MKKFFLVAVLVFFGSLGPAVRASASITAYFFYGEGCPHCAKEEAYLQTLTDKYPDLEIKKFEVYYNSQNAQLLQKTAEKLGVSGGGVPFLIIGDKHFIGYSEGLTAKKIEEQIIKYQNLTPPSDQKEKIINLPLLGEINVLAFSLPALTLVVGFLDGFNPCAMWTLLFLISLLLGLENRKRMWILGAAFIVASALVYFLFMAAWLNLILFLGFIVWIRMLVGLLALLGGGYNLKEFFLNKEDGCKVANNDKRQRVFLKLKAIVSQNSFWLALGGIIILAFMVNLVELFCSAGLPAVYTQVLTLNELAGWQYYLYILLYIFFFMLDDLLVFLVAMTTLELTGLTTKYTRYSRLIGGLLMFLIGLLLIFKPEWLMFG